MGVNTDASDSSERVLQAQSRIGEAMYPFGRTHRSEFAMLARMMWWVGDYWIYGKKIRRSPARGRTEPPRDMLRRGPQQEDDVDLRNGCVWSSCRGQDLRGRLRRAERALPKLREKLH
jgi:hypothetical protein